MDNPVKKKALSPHRKEKCIVFPLVRYNEFRQPVCQVCNVIMESIRAHLTSPEHNEVMEKVKANAAASANHNNGKPFTGTNTLKANPEQPGDTNTPKANPEQPGDAERQLPESSQDVPKDQSPSALPRDFCDDSGKIRTRSVSKVTGMMDSPKEQEHLESNQDSARMKSKVSPSPVEALTSSKRGRPRKTKPTKFVLNQTSKPSSTPRRSKRIKHVADKSSKDMPEVSTSDELLKVKLITLLKGHAAENSQGDGKEVSSDIDALVIYKRKRLPRRRSYSQTRKAQRQRATTEPSIAAISSSATASLLHEDLPAHAPANCDTHFSIDTDTVEPLLSKSLVEEVEKVNPAPANAQEQVASSKSQESPNQVDLKADEVSTVNTPLDLETINKMIEDDPLSAIENILTGKVSISSKTPQSTIQSEPPKAESSTAEALSKELKELMQNFSLHDFVTDYEQMSKVLLILEELQKNEKFLSLTQQTFIKAFRHFFNNAVSHRKECDTVKLKKVELNQAKEDILLKQQEAKHTQEQITSSISNSNNRVNEISSYIQQLEEQISKLKEERETFQLAINEGEKQRETLKNDSILWAHQAKDLVFDLAEIEVKVKTLGDQLEADNSAYVQFRESFPV